MQRARQGANRRYIVIRCGKIDLDCLATSSGGPFVLSGGAGSVAQVRQVWAVPLRRNE